MKLSHLSLAVFSAIALAACGGSNSDQTTIKKKEETPKEVVPGKQDPTIVSNKANALTVPASSEAAVAAAKQIYFTRAAKDRAIGYRVPNATNPMRYQPGATNDADILRESSIVNYLDANWVNDNASIRFNPLQTYALGRDGQYYRVKEPNARATGPAVNWANANASDTFQIVGAAALGGAFGRFGNGTNIPASALVYIPNVWSIPGANGAGNETATTAYVPRVGGGNGSLSASQQNQIDANAVAGVNVIDPSNITFAATPSAANVFDVDLYQVRPNNLHFAGKSYAIDALDNDVEIDLSGVKTAEEIQTLPITFDYTIVDNKGTQSTNDDDRLTKTAQAGSARVYNLNYSRAMVVLNQAATEAPDSANAAARNTLGLNNGGRGYQGPYQVVGRATGTVPTNGRAIYDGKSFGVNSTGDIRLEADFGIDRASILGSISNRVAKRGDADRKLPDLNLQEILLSQPSRYSETGSATFNNRGVAADGAVDVGGTNVGSWAVQLYGANAETAAGLIFDNGGRPIEVFNSARGDIDPKSLNN